MRFSILLIVSFFCLVTPALALEGTASDKAWALKWEKQAKKNERHARQHGKFMGHNGRLPWYLSYEISRSDFETWKDYGYRIKRRSYSLSKRIKRTWRLMRYPNWRKRGANAWIPLARHAGWPTKALPMLRKVIRRESSGNPRCVTGAHIGLMQISRRHTRCNLFNPYTNLRYALKMWRRQGWRPWAQTAY